MDWYLDARDGSAVSELRREITRYLARHADAAGDLEAAELVVSELLGNVARHAPGPAWVSLTWSGAAPELVVYDLGGTFDPTVNLGEALSHARADAEEGRGLLLVSAFAPRLQRAARAAGGNRVRATLPVQRVQERSYRPEPRAGPPLPGLDEAMPEGGFGRETFLRALVVELAQAVERTGGPALSEQVVAQVGASVGSQMEAEFRHAQQIVGRLSTDQLGTCLVRLKHAINGGFRVVEMSDDRIVFMNDRCPFGEVVQRSPALCRMTSSVFGGIAARNAGSKQAAVVLEERIAVGDPHCRVVVQLGPPPHGTESFAHRYADAPDDTSG